MDFVSEFKEFGDFQLFAAPTAEEILERLPNNIHDKDGFPTWLMCTKNLSDTWEVGYVRTDSFEDGMTTDMSLAEAAGKMFLYLAENHLLKKINYE